MSARCRRLVLFVTGNRSEYGLLQPVIRATQRHPDLEAVVAVTGAHLDARFGETIGEVLADGNRPLEAPAGTGDGSTGGMVDSLAECLRALRPVCEKTEADVGVVLGDRLEALAGAIACLYMNVPVAHLHGGDRDFCVMPDQSVRYAITKLAHLHFAACEDSRQRILALGEEPWRVFNVGSPAVDNALSEDYASPEELRERLALDLEQPILVFCQHPVTSRPLEASAELVESLEALKEVGVQTVVTWPNNDAGGLDMLETLAMYGDEAVFRHLPNLGRRHYTGLLRIASAIVGNSSSGIIESASYGIPAVNIGDRQDGRLRAENVLDVECRRAAIVAGIRKALEDREFRRRCRDVVNPYGDGHCGERVAMILAQAPRRERLLAKRITY